MSLVRGFLLDFCPVNLFRPTFPDHLPISTMYSLRKIYNEALVRDIDGFNRNLRLVYSLDENVHINDYEEMLSLYNNHLKYKRITIKNFLYMNAYGCVHRTNEKLYANLRSSMPSADGDPRTVYHAAFFILMLQVICLMSIFKVTEIEWLQNIFSCSLVAILVPAFMFAGKLWYKVVSVLVLWLTMLLKKFNFIWPPWGINVAENRETGRVKYIAWCRGIMTIGTIAAILAVDSIYFNTLHSKTFYGGFSSMDSGCGLFIMHSGCLLALSSKIFLRHEFLLILLTGGRKRSLSLIFRRNAVLFALGFLRQIVLKLLNYGFSVKEYGAHWNFFLSLAVSKSVTEICLKLPEKVVFLLPIALTSVFEWFFISCDVINKFPFIERTGIVTANKEGIIAIPNSVSMCLIGYCTMKVAIKFYRRSKGFIAASFELMIFALSLAISWLLGWYGIPCSRTLHNARFVLNITSVKCLGTGMCLLFYLLFPDRGSNNGAPLCESVGMHSLSVFLLANVLVGLVNMTLYTLLLPKALILTIIVIYMFVCLLTAFLLEKTRFIKF